MTKDPSTKPDANFTSSPLPLEKVEKGSHRSMWDFLLQLRVLLPYISQLVPLLDRGSRSAPDFSTLSKGVTALQTGSRDLEVQARNQALRLERIEEHIERLRLVHENHLEENRKLFATLQTFRQWIVTLAIFMVVLLGAAVGMIAYLVVRT